MPGSGRAVRVVNVLRVISTPSGNVSVYLTYAPIDLSGVTAVNVPVPLTLSQNEALDVILDFDAAASVQVNETGSAKYILRPVITPVGVKNP